jgi:MoaA/NifB/PqqE/SkfB family radical SAM enzyme
MSYIDPASKLMAHADRIAQIQQGLTPAPVNVEIDLSNRCNLGCDACHFGHVHSRGPLARRRTHDTGDLMSEELVLRLPGELEAAGVRSITWTGGGEPTLHPQFEQAITGHGLDQGMYTNGTTIMPELAELIKRNMQWVYVSLDRMDRESYRAYKKVDAFDRAVFGIRSLVAAKGGATVGVGYLLSKDNYQSIPAMALFAKMLGADYCQFRPQVDFDPEHPGASQPQPWIAEAIPALERVVGDGFALADVNRFKMLLDWQGHGYPVCYWTQMQATITPDGRVWRCVNRRGFEGDCIGDLNTECFGEIWQRSQPYNVNDQCRVMCRGHLPNIALNQAMRPGPHWRFI